MNFLAHLQLAALANSSLLGNLLADFVRGSPHGYPLAVSQGIYFHRRVDSVADQLAIIQQARALFGPTTRRVAPITLDVVWDHFLARDWHNIHLGVPLVDFNQWAGQQIQTSAKGLLLPEAFISLNRVIWSEQWLIHYADLPFIDQVLTRMAKRRPRLAALADSFIDVKQHYQQLEQLFWQFYPSLQQTVQDPHFIDVTQ